MSRPVIILPELTILLPTAKSSPTAKLLPIAVFPDIAKFKAST